MVGNCCKYAARGTLPFLASFGSRPYGFNPFLYSEFLSPVTTSKRLAMVPPLGALFTLRNTPSALLTNKRII